MPTNNFELYRVSEAKEELKKADYARWQTSEGKTKNGRTIINVTHDEAIVISWALSAYIQAHRWDGDRNE